MTSDDKEQQIRTIIGGLDGRPPSEQDMTALKNLFLYWSERGPDNAPERIMPLLREAHDKIAAGDPGLAFDIADYCATLARNNIMRPHLIDFYKQAYDGLPEDYRLHALHGTLKSLRASDPFRAEILDLLTEKASLSQNLAEKAAIYFTVSLESPRGSSREVLAAAAWRDCVLSDPNVRAPDVFRYHARWLPYETAVAQVAIAALETIARSAPPPMPSGP